eukprot:1160307-Pyramimonas_sp.AAC.2
MTPMLELSQRLITMRFEHLHLPPNAFYFVSQIRNVNSHARIAACDADAPLPRKLVTTAEVWQLR